MCHDVLNDNNDELKDDEEEEPIRELLAFRVGKKQKMTHGNAVEVDFTKRFCFGDPLMNGSTSVDFPPTKETRSSTQVSVGDITTTAAALDRETLASPNARETVSREWSLFEDEIVSEQEQLLDDLMSIINRRRRTPDEDIPCGQPQPSLEEVPAMSSPDEYDPEEVLPTPAKKQKTEQAYRPTPKTNIPTVRTEKRVKTSHPRKQVHRLKDTKVSLDEVVLFHLPTLAICLLTRLREKITMFLRSAVTPTATEAESIVFKDLQKHQEYNRALTCILKYWAKMYAANPTSERSLQDSLALQPESSLSSEYIALPVAQTFRKLFELCLANTNKEVLPTGIVTTASSPPLSTIKTSGNMYMCSTPAPGQITPADAECSNPSETFESLVAGGPGQQTLYLPKMSTSLRSITSRIRNRSCTARWEGNKGDYLIKQEVYRWSDIQTLPARDWWKYAIHRSQVFGNEGEEHVLMAARRAHHLRHLWVDETAGTPRMEGVTLTSDMVPQAPPQQAWVTGPTTNSTYFMAPPPRQNGGQQDQISLMRY